MPLASPLNLKSALTFTEVIIMNKWMCTFCGTIYDEKKGWPEESIAAGTKFEDIPDDWLCPDCGMSKDDFESY